MLVHYQKLLYLSIGKHKNVVFGILNSYCKIMRIFIYQNLSNAKRGICFIS